MSGSSPLNDKTILQHRRTRKSHAKVKTGCTTCKIRRKKCDETKPYCRRCTSTGRKCDGYEVYQSTTSIFTPTNLPREPHTSQLVRCDISESDATGSFRSGAALNLTRIPPMVICRSPPAITFGSEVDYHCFNFFRLNSAPRFASYFDSSIWQSTVMKLAFAHPTILKAATAVGAVHRRFDYGISREAFEYCAIADRLKKAAIKDFTRFIREEGTHSAFRQVVILASLLFGVFESFQGNDDEAVQHMTFGLNSLWRTPLLVVQSESRYLNYDIGPSFFHRMFETLENRAAQLLGYRPRIVTPYQSDRSLPSLPPCFSSIKDAIETIFTQADWIMRTPVRVWFDQDECRKFQRMHVSYILTWSAAYAEMVQTQPELDEIQTQTCMVAKRTRDVLYTLIYIIFCVRARASSDLQSSILDELAMNVVDTRLDIQVGNVNHFYDTPSHVDTNMIAAHSNSKADSCQPLLQHPKLWHHITSHPSMVTKLTRLALLVESRCSPSSIYTYTSNHSFSLDSGIGPPLSSTPSPEGSSKTRHLVKTLLTRDIQPDVHSHESEDDDDDNDDSSLWHKMGVYSVAERISSIEEYAVLSAVAGLGLDVNATNANVVRGRGLAPRAGAITGSRDGSINDASAIRKPNWVDITAFLEEGRLLVRYCQDDGLGSRGKGLVWVQEWLQF